MILSNNIVENLRLHAKSRPSYPAMVHADKVLSYSDLWFKVTCLAASLRQKGIGQSSTVGVCLGDNMGHLISLHALAFLGAIILPMDIRWKTSEKNRVLFKFNATFVITESELDITSDIEVVRISIDEKHSWDGLEPLKTPIQAESLPLILSLSSGTTGAPNGPLITHENMICRFEGHRASLGFCQHDRFVLATPLYFGGGRGFSMSYLHAGGTVILCPPPMSITELAVTIADREGDVLFLVPTQIRQLLMESTRTRKHLTSLRLLISSGAPLHPHERTEVRKRICSNYCNYYSSTEGGGISVQRANDDELHVESVGKAVYQVEIEIVDREHQCVEEGGMGLIRYRGPGVAKEYFHSDNRERELGAFFRDGWFYPGDLGSLNTDGYLFLHGRERDMIIRAGVNIFPSEIELILSQHPDVIDVSVTGRVAHLHGEEVVAFIVPRNAEVKEEDLIDYSRGQLAPYKVPERIYFIDSIPRNRGGKVIKSELIGN